MKEIRTDAEATQSIRDLDWAISVLDQVIDIAKFNADIDTEEGELEKDLLSKEQFRIRNQVGPLYCLALLKEGFDTITESLNKAMDLFRLYGYRVEKYGAPNSFIAYNDKYCIPCSVVRSSPQHIAACSMDVSCMEMFKESYADNPDMQVGFKAYNHMQKWKNDGMCLCNHDHTLFEIEYFLKNTSPVMID